MSVYDKLQALNIALPPVATPAAVYLPFVQTGNLVFLSGHIAKKDGQVWTGQLGKTMQTAEGAQAHHVFAALCVAAKPIQVFSGTAGHHAFAVFKARGCVVLG